jgi:NTE family protein
MSAESAEDRTEVQEPEPVARNKDEAKHPGTVESEQAKGTGFKAEDDEPSRRKRGIALCLSGGGYRAALFHLGALRCLSEAGILKNIDSVSSVSGGSILAAYLVRRMRELGMSNGLDFSDWESDVATGFRKVVRTDIRTIPFFTHIGWNWFWPKWRAAHLIRNYRKHLTTPDGSASELTTGDLPQKPDFIFCATDITFGVNWEFRRERVGDFKIGYSTSGKWPLSLAVGASSCFPPIFGPVTLWAKPGEFSGGNVRKDSKEARLLNRLQLTDGGVYDNFGLEPVNDEHRTVIVSDGGSPFAFGTGRIPLLRNLRYLAVIMNQVAALRKQSFNTDIGNGLHDGLYCGIGRGLVASTVPFSGYTKTMTTNALSKIRTDLDRFSDSEAKILENHGYFVMLNRLSSKLPALMPMGFSLKIPHASLAEEGMVTSLLKRSHRRFSITRLLGVGS